MASLTVQHCDALLAAGVELWARAVVRSRVVNHRGPSRARHLDNTLVYSDPGNSRDCIHLYRGWLRVQMASQHELHPGQTQPS